MEYFLLFFVGLIIAHMILRQQHKDLQDAQSRSIQNIRELEEEKANTKTEMEKQASQIHEIIRLLREYIPDALPDTLSYDPVRDYLSDDEWNRLSAVLRERLALTRYNKSERTDWELGRDYEMSVAEEYRRKGYQVETRTHLRYKDMGVDTIARRGNEVLLIQCKYWSQDSLVRENVIFQLFGSWSFFRFRDPDNEKIYHALLITSTALSKEAKEVAECLGIYYCEKHPITGFNRIKCSITRDEQGNEVKLYYLPMDEHYDNIQIQAEGECFVTDPQEAIDKGFRRAYQC